MGFKHTKKLHQDQEKYLGFNDKWLVLIGIPFIAFIIPSLFFGQLPVHGLKVFCSSWIISIIFTTIFWIGNRQILIFFRKKYQLPEENRRRVIITFTWILAFTISVNIIAGLLFPATDGTMAFRGQGTFAGVFVTVFLITIYEAAWASLKWRLATVETEHLRRENLQSQLSILKSQVNPHFLFNSLNTLTAIIPEEPEKAVSFVQNLSRVYRCILELKDEQVITLKEELTCVESYIFLLQTRFGKNLSIEMNIAPAALQSYIVPLSLQLLIENAIKHNVVSARKPLRIVIWNTPEQTLVVENNLQLKDQEEVSTGTGLQNIDNRYQLVSNQRITVEESETHYTVTLPLLQINNYESSNY